MANLPESGISMVAQGASAYISDVNKAAGATDKFIGGLGSAAGKSGGFSNIMTGALRRIGEVAVNALGQAAMAAGKFLADSVKSAGDVEQTLNVLGATSGATAAQLDKVRAMAIALGGDLSLPATSAQDAAEAMFELSKAGFSVDEAMAAAKGTLQLAAAAQISAGDAAAISATAINAFGLEAKDAAHIADLLTGAANASQVSIMDMAAGMQQAGFAFNAAGEPIDDMMTSLTALTKVGLTGSDAGTALKNAMMRLMNPTDKAAQLMNQLGINAYDAQGKMLPWPAVLENIRTATAGMTDEQRNAALGTIFLSDGMKAMIPLLDMSAADYTKLAGEVGKVGSAEMVAGAQTVGFNGAIAGLQSQLETLQLIIGTKVLPLLTPLIQQVGAGVSVFAEWAGAVLSSTSPMDTLTAQFPVLGMAITTVMTIFTQLSAFITSVMPSILGIIQSTLTIVTALWQQHGAQWMQQVQSVFTIIQGVIQVVMGVIQGILAITMGLITGDWSTAMTQLSIANQTIWTGIQNILTGILDNILAYFGTTTDAVLTSWADGLAQLIVSTTTGVNNMLAALKTAIAPATSIGKAIIDGMVGGVTSAAQSLANAAADVVRGALAAARAAIHSRSPSKDFADKVGLPIAQGIAVGVKSGQGAVNTAIEGLVGEGLSKAKKSVSKSAASAVTAASATAPLSGAGLIGSVSRNDKQTNPMLPSVSALALLSNVFKAVQASQQAMDARPTAVVARPTVAGGGSNTTNNSRVLNYQPQYGLSSAGNPSTDALIARSLAL